MLEPVSMFMNEKIYFLCLSRMQINIVRFRTSLSLTSATTDTTAHVACTTKNQNYTFAYEVCGASAPTTLSQLFGA